MLHNMNRREHKYNINTYIDVVRTENTKALALIKQTDNTERNILYIK
jgi:hypothetical protein